MSRRRRHVANREIRGPHIMSGDPGGEDRHNHEDRDDGEANDGETVHMESYK